MTDAKTVPLASLADDHFVALTTFRKSGVPVSTPVWIARDGDALLVTTPAGTGKVKRLRNNSRVEIRPCNRMGKVKDDAPVAIGVATMDPELPRETKIFSDKYKLEYRIFMAFERRGKAGQKPRLILRITER
jgi:PPOX class probable F420-dependent enzyme